MRGVARPCLGFKRESCGEPTLNPGSRCDRHEAMYQAGRRPSPDKRGYTKAYRAEREELLRPNESGERALCQLRLPGCTRWADTADHVDPVDAGRNREAVLRPRLRPACKHCNYARGKRTLKT